MKTFLTNEMSYQVGSTILDPKWCGNIKKDEPV